jgi:carbon monoxide dehydrogenase subunit G
MSRGTDFLVPDYRMRWPSAMCGRRLVLPSSGFGRRIGLNDESPSGEAAGAAMELEHHFEVPVGIDQAWTHLLDMEKVAHCFPGATLTSADGAEYAGTVKVKLGPIQLTYEGAARIVSADEASRTATIEASGAAARSGSTATMKVTATASAIAADRTAVDMQTDLAITGRPAQFGRGVMVEVGNKILGKFADCLSATLAATNQPEAAVGADAAGGTADAAAATGAQVDAGGAAKHSAESEGSTDAAKPAPASTYTRAPGGVDNSEPIDLLESARGSIVKRVAPLVAALGIVCLVRLCLRRRRARCKG